MYISAGERLQVFLTWLRAGRLPAAPIANAIELKFNPYHDPRNGRFTFAPGGPRLPRRVSGSSHRRAAAAIERRATSPTAFSSFLRGTLPPDNTISADPAADLLNDAVFRPSGADLLQRMQFRPSLPRGAGSNSRPFEDPLTLEQAFPGLRKMPGGSILGLADNILDVTGPRSRLTTQMSLDYSRKLINDIKAVDPRYQFHSLGVPVTFEGQIRQVNGLRLDLASALYCVRGETEALQGETLRFRQESVDRAYDAGVQLCEQGKLNLRLHRNEAIGNFVDRQVRNDLRELYGGLGISTAKDQHVRVNGREYDTSGTDSTYRTPDARVGKVVFDWTLERKTGGLAQVRGYFNSDLKPRAVIIVRPSQLGPQSTYAITRPRS